MAALNKYLARSNKPRTGAKLILTSRGPTRRAIPLGAPVFVEETASPVANSKQPSQQGLTREVVLPGINSNEPSVTLAIRMRLGETEEIFQLPVTQEMISRLMFEAHVREINVAELLAELITAKLKTGFWPTGSER